MQRGVETKSASQTDFPFQIQLFFQYNKQEPMWTCDKLQRADLTYYIARGIRETINTQYEIDSLIAHI